MIDNEEELRNKIIDEARTFLGTRWQHIGRSKEHGVDCVGLISCVLQNLDFEVNDLLNYTHMPDFKILQKKLLDNAFLIDFKDIKKGDILTFKFEKTTTHVGFISEIKESQIYIIHAYSLYPRKVVEHIIDKRWINQISGCYRLNIFKEII
jgi:hypothetical protein